MEYRTTTDEPVTRIQAETGIWLEGNLTLPVKPEGLVVFAHGSGSSRLSPRNRFVAKELQQAGLGTFLFDLLTRQDRSEDEVTGRFNINLLAKRLMAVTDWLKSQELTRSLRFKPIRDGHQTFRQEID